MTAKALAEPGIAGFMCTPSPYSNNTLALQLEMSVNTAHQSLNKLPEQLVLTNRTPSPFQSRELQVERKAGKYENQETKLFTLQPALKVFKNVLTVTPET